MMLLSVCIVYFLAACSENDKSINPNPPDVIFPLEIGNQWVYQNLDQDTIQYIDTLNCLSAKVINNNKYYLIQYADSKSGILITNKAKGVYYLQDSIEDVCMALYPCVAGDTFHYVRNYTFVVASTDELVDVPAGSFKCIKYQSITPVGVLLTRLENWYCIGIGLVRSCFSYKLNSEPDAIFKRVSDRKLLSFSLRK